MIDWLKAELDKPKRTDKDFIEEDVYIKCLKKAEETEKKITDKLGNVTRGLKCNEDREIAFKIIREEFHSPVNPSCDDAPLSARASVGMDYHSPTEQNRSNSDISVGATGRTRGRGSNPHSVPADISLTDEEISDLKYLVNIWSSELPIGFLDRFAGIIGRYNRIKEKLNTEGKA